MIRRCNDSDFQAIWAVIHEAAQVYKGIIPADRWSEPYMPAEKLRHEIADGVVFWGWEEEGELTGVMGLQEVQDVTLIRHAYVLSRRQRGGIGGRLLTHLLEAAQAPVLIGTWADAHWAIRFYEKNGFEMVTPQEKDRLLRRYWNVPERQIETSVVLADAAWRENRE
jgi:GNAT superfamily N-acetyltransferase